MKIIAALLGVSVATVAAAMTQDAMKDGAVSPDSHWWLTVSECRINGNWPGDPPFEIYLQPHTDHHHLALISTGWMVNDGEQATISIGFDQVEAAFADQAAYGYDNAAGASGWRFEVSAPLLEAVRGGKSIEFYRDGKEIVSLDLASTAEAVVAMQDCLANQIAVDAAADEPELDPAAAARAAEEDVASAVADALNAADAAVAEENASVADVPN